MTNEEKQLLFKDLCARLPYGVILDVDNGKYREDKKIWPGLFNSDSLWDAKPYLRPMSSMTEEEKTEWLDGGLEVIKSVVRKRASGIDNEPNAEADAFSIDWLNAHQFDYRIDPSTGKTLIESGLALEAPEGMYNTK